MKNSEEVVFTPWPYDAVARGAALLDEEIPGWREVIQIERLDMGDCWLCVLGQYFGDFIDGCIGLGIEDDSTLASHYGFDRVEGLTEAVAYDALTQAWREELART